VPSLVTAYEVSLVSADVTAWLKQEKWSLDEEKWKLYPAKMVISW